MDHYSIRNIASQRGIGMGRRIKDLRVNAADAFLGIPGLDGRIGVFRDADTAHREKSGRGLRMRKAETSFSGPATKSLANLTGFEGNDVHPLGGWIDEVKPLRVVIGMTGPTLSVDKGLNRAPIRADHFLRRTTGGAGLQGKEGEKENDVSDTHRHLCILA